MKKIVVKVCMNDDIPKFCCFNLRSSRSKALSVVSGFQGVKSVKIEDDKDQIEMTGDCDSVALTTLLRKKVGFAEIITVSEADAKESKSKDTSDKKRDPQPVVYPCPCPCPRSEVVIIGDSYPEPRCLFF
ncbi:hypothetical protein ACJRO7_007177 [Eucalyptus globulus]|uniref:HMA domain-containing protein n=1 Tax=Eucalyptus globulus TaxID=34317 RepID=A0ABD3IKA4_EUCGL